MEILCGFFLDNFWDTYRCHIFIQWVAFHLKHTHPAHIKKEGIVLKVEEKIKNLRPRDAASHSSIRATLAYRKNHWFLFHVFTTYRWWNLDFTYAQNPSVCYLFPQIATKRKMGCLTFFFQSRFLYKQQVQVLVLHQWEDIAHICPRIAKNWVMIPETAWSDLKKLSFATAQAQQAQPDIWTMSPGYNDKIIPLKIVSKLASSCREFGRPSQHNCFCCKAMRIHKLPRQADFGKIS